MNAANNNFNDELIDRTREVWQPRLGHNLDPDEAQQIAACVTGFFAILAEWSRADMPDPENDNVDATASGEERVRDGR